MKGKPTAYISGHNRRKHGQKYDVVAAGYMTPCWLYRVTNQDGYGRAWNGEKQVPAHRLYYERAVGPIPAGLQIDHLCRNRACVNPEHLEPVTQIENVRRGASVKLDARAKEAIRADSTATLAELAKRFNVSISAIWDVRTGHKPGAPVS